VSWLLNTALDQSATVAGYSALEASRALHSNVAAIQIKGMPCKVDARIYAHADAMETKVDGVGF